MNDKVTPERSAQAGRCFNCGVPFCQSGIEFEGKLLGCPLHNLIPEWNDMLRKGNASHALTRLLKVNCFPEITGRICPAFCQAGCVRRGVDSVVRIKDNELFLAEYGFENGLIVPEPPETRSGKTVAVVGSGPMGLAVAWYLNRRGHLVTVFEKEKELGGGLARDISEKLLPREVISRRIDLMEREGISFCPSTAVADLSRPVEGFDRLCDCTDSGAKYAVIAIEAGKKLAAEMDKELMGWTNISF